MNTEKRWISPEIDELNLSDTQYGGKQSSKFDQQWYDEKGALHVNFEGDGNNDAVS